VDGISLGITPALTAMLAPLWGRLGDRFGRKIMVERSLVSFVVLFTAMAFVTSVWQVLAVRAIQGLFAGYGSLSVAMAAESAPRDRMPSAIGAVQTAQRIGPGVGPVIGGIFAQLFGLRNAFLVTSMFYAIGLVLVHLAYDDHAIHRRPRGSARDRPGDVPQRARVREFHPDDAGASSGCSSSIAASGRCCRCGSSRSACRATRVALISGVPVLDHGVHRGRRPSFLRPAAAALQHACGHRRRRRVRGVRVRRPWPVGKFLDHECGVRDLRHRHRRGDDGVVHRRRGA
jgi:hypothetical protein